jgi:hypothetical protein
MTKRLMYSFTVILLAAASMHAAQPITAEILFSFNVGDSTFPSGSYTADTSVASGSVLRLRSADGKSSVLILSYGTLAPSGQNQPKLVFHRYGNEFFLYQVWMGNGETGRELRKSRREAEVAAAAQRSTQTIIAGR